MSYRLAFSLGKMRTIFSNLVTRVPIWILRGQHRKAETPAVQMDTLIGERSLLPRKQGWNEGTENFCHCSGGMTILGSYVLQMQVLGVYLALRSILSLGTCQQGLKTKQKKQMDSQVSFLVIVGSRDCAADSSNSHLAGRLRTHGVGFNRPPFAFILTPATP